MPEDHNKAFIDSYDLSLPVVSDRGRDLIDYYDVKMNDEGRLKRTTIFLRGGGEMDLVTGLFGVYKANSTSKRVGVATR